MSADWIAVSDHAAERWTERTTSPGIGPRVAWNESVRVAGLDGPRGDDIRYHQPTDLVLVADRGTLVTVLEGPELSHADRQTLATQQLRTNGGETA